MGSKQRRPWPPCNTYEVCHRDSAGEFTQTPFSDELARSGVLSGNAIKKMRLLEQQVRTDGWDVGRRSLKDGKGRQLVVRKDDLIWLLKCKPSCWRLYFYVSKSE